MNEQSNDIAQELALLHQLSGADYARQVEHIARRNEFRLVGGETAIFTVGGEGGKNYDNLLSAAKRAVEQVHKVYILPNLKVSYCRSYIGEKRCVQTL